MRCGHLLARAAPVHLEERLRVGRDDLLDGLLAKELRPIAVPRAAAARATATSPSGCTACTPVGEMITGSEIGCPSTVVASSRSAGSPADVRGEAELPERGAGCRRSVMPFSDPATSAP